MNFLKRQRWLLLLTLSLTAFAQQFATFASLPDITGTGAVVPLATGSPIYSRWVQLQAPAANSAGIACCDPNISSSRGVQIVPGGVFFLPAAGPVVDLTHTYVLIGSGDKLKLSYLVSP